MKALWRKAFSSSNSSTYIKVDLILPATSVKFPINTNKTSTSNFKKVNNCDIEHFIFDIWKFLIKYTPHFKIIFLAILVELKGQDAFDSVHSCTMYNCKYQG